jgi:hypothetical protein
MLHWGHDGIGRLGEFCAGEGGAADFGGDAESPGDLSQSHFLKIFLAEVFQEALGSGDEFLGGFPFLLAEAIEPAGPVGGLFALAGGLGFGVLLEEAGVERLQAFAPVMFAGPVFDRAKVFAEFIGDGLKTAGMAELEEGHEGAVGPRGLAGEALEGSAEFGLRNAEFRRVLGRTGALRDAVPTNRDFITSVPTILEGARQGSGRRGNRHGLVHHWAFLYLSCISDTNYTLSELSCQGKEVA